MAGVLQSFDAAGGRQTVDLLRDGARRDQQPAKQVRGSLGVRRATATEREQHAHVSSADPMLALAIAVVVALQERSNAHEIDREQKVLEVEVAHLGLQLQRDQFAQRRTCIALVLLGLAVVAVVLLSDASLHGLACLLFGARYRRRHRKLAAELGADWVGGAADKPPKELDSGNCWYVGTCLVHATENQPPVLATPVSETYLRV